MRQARYEFQDKMPKTWKAAMQEDRRKKKRDRDIFGVQVVFNSLCNYAKSCMECEEDFEHIRRDNFPVDFDRNTSFWSVADRWNAKDGHWLELVMFSYELAPPVVAVAFKGSKVFTELVFESTREEIDKAERRISGWFRRHGRTKK